MVVERFCAARVDADAAEGGEVFGVAAKVGEDVADRAFGLVFEERIVGDVLGVGSWAGVGVEGEPGSWR